MVLTRRQQRILQDSASSSDDSSSQDVSKVKSETPENIEKSPQVKLETTTKQTVAKEQEVEETSDEKSQNSVVSKKTGSRQKKKASITLRNPYKDPRNIPATRGVASGLFLLIVSLYLRFHIPIHEFIDEKWPRTHESGQDMPTKPVDEVKPLSAHSPPLNSVAPRPHPLSHMNHVTNLINGFHFEDIARDTPWQYRPPSLLLFRDESCQASTDKLHFPNKWAFPSRQEVFLGIYNTDVKNDLWYNWEEEMDLAKRFGVTSCPELVMVSRDYALENRTAEIVKWDGKGSWDVWANATLAAMSEGKEKSSNWSVQRMKSRDRVETLTHERRRNIPPRLPHFSEHGWKKLKMPKELHQSLRDFYTKWEPQRSQEEWSSSGTQTNFHEKPMTLVYLDLDPVERDRIAKQYIQPIVEEWANLNQLKLTAFYGIREYYRGSELRTHLDRTDTHVLSAILQIDQINVDEPWLLEVYDFNGTRLELDMDPGDMVLYESASLAHGRPRPMQGDKYINAFCHFAPVNWNYRMKGSTVGTTEGTEDFKAVKDPLPALKKENCPLETFDLKSGNSDQKASVVIRNAAGEALQVFWMDFEGREQHAAFLDPGEDTPISSFINHAFRVKFQRDRTVAQEFTVESEETTVVVGTCPVELRGKKGPRPAYARDEL